MRMTLVAGVLRVVAMVECDHCDDLNAEAVSVMVDVLNSRHYSVCAFLFACTHPSRIHSTAHHADTIDKHSTALNERIHC